MDSNGIVEGSVLEGLGISPKVVKLLTSVNSEDFQLGLELIRDNDIAVAFCIGNVWIEFLTNQDHQDWENKYRSIYKRNRELYATYNKEINRI